MSINMNEFDNDEREIRAAFSLIRVNPNKLAVQVKSQMRTEAATRTPRMKRSITLVAAIIAAVALSTTAFAFAFGGFDWFLDRVDPAFGDIVEPMMVYSEDQGIQMTVLGAQKFDTMAIFYISLQDVTGENRLTDSAGLMHGFQVIADEDESDIGAGLITRGMSSSSGLLYFDEATNTAFFEIQVTMDTAMPDALTLSTGMITFEVDRFEDVVIPLSLANIGEVPTITGLSLEYVSANRREVEETVSSHELLTPGRLAALPDYTDDNWISNIGVVDGQLRVQTLQEITGEMGFGGGGVNIALMRPDGEVFHADSILWSQVDSTFTPVNFMTYWETHDRTPPYHLSEFIFDVDLDNLAEYTVVFTGLIIHGAIGDWQIELDMADTINQIVTISEEIQIDYDLHVEFITLTPLGLQMMGSFTSDDDESFVHTVGIAHIEIDGELVLIEGSSGWFDGSGRFSMTWRTGSPIDVAAVTAIIIDGVRIETP